MILPNSEWSRVIKKAAQLLNDPNTEIVWFDEAYGIVLRSNELEIAIRFNPRLASLKFHTAANNKKLEFNSTSDGLQSGGLIKVF